MASSDLVPKMLPFLDKHFLLLVLDFYEQSKSHDVRQIHQRRYEILRGTLMPAKALDAYRKSVGDDAAVPPPEHQLVSLEEAAKRATEALSAAQGAISFATGGGQAAGADSAADPDLWGQIIRHAKVLYEAGRYADALQLLSADKLSIQSLSFALKKAVLFGRLACQIMMGHRISPTFSAASYGGVFAASADDPAMQNIRSLRLAVESSYYAASSASWQPVLPSEQRAMVPEQAVEMSRLLHWALFLMPGASFADFCRSESRLDTRNVSESKAESYLLNKALEMAPYLWRYLSIGTLLSRVGKRKDRIQAVISDRIPYDDALSRFYLEQFMRCDVDKGLKVLGDAVELVRADFFFQPIQSEIVEELRFSWLDIFCRLHGAIELSLLSQNLGLSTEQTEQWLVTLIRTNRLDAKIDARGHVSVCPPSMNVFQTLLYDKERKRPHAMQLSQLLAKVQKT